MPTFPPPLNAPAEDVDSPFYGVVPLLKAAKPKNALDGERGVICAKTGYWVPRSRAKKYRGRWYFDVVCPTAPEFPPDPPQGITSF